MPIQRSDMRRDGHDPLKRANNIDTPYASTLRRAPNTGMSRPVPRTNDADALYEDEDEPQANYDTQGIIELEPKTQRRRPNDNLTSSASIANRQTSGSRQQVMSASTANRQPTSARQQVMPASAANRQPTSARQQAMPASAANRQPTSTRQQVMPASAANRQPTSARQQMTPAGIANRKTTDPRRESRQLVEKGARQRKQFHWLVPTGVTMIITIVCYLLLYVVWTGGHSIYNNMAYGATTRTSHLEAVVGDHDSAAAPTHFMAVNLHGTINVIEFPGSDVTHAKVYPGPHLLWSNADKAVVTLEVKNGAGNQRPDIVVHIQGDTDILFRQTTANFILHNNGSGFAPMIALP